MTHTPAITSRTPVAPAQVAFRTCAPPARGRRRAFALPLVILLTLIGGLAVVLFLDRHAGSHRAVVREVQVYQDHHRGAGIMEAILRWIETAKTRGIEQSLDPDGLAFAMELQGGATISVYLRDAQGAALSDPSTVSGRRREIVEDMNLILQNLPEPLKVKGLFRPAGPPEISVNAAPPIVIEALCMAVTGDQGKAESAARTVLALRTDDKIRPGQIEQALRDAGMTAQQTREVAAMLVSQPHLYECIAVSATSAGRVVDRSSGLYPIEDGRQDTIKQSGAFLTWQQLPLE